jgi:uncharacterized protein
MKRVAARLLLALSSWALVGCANGTGSSAAASSRATEAPGSPAEPPSPAAQPAAPPAATAKKLGTPQPTLPVGTLVLETPPRAPITLKVEVASTDAQRQTGMMFRESMAEDEGMLFVFPTERHNSFWMHNTLIPLDMFFIDSEWNVVGVVEQATPQTDDARGVPKMSQYVLELKGGFAARHELDAAALANTKVRFTPPPETHR